MIHATAKVSEEANRKFPHMYTVQLSTPYIDPGRHNTHRHRHTDRLTDRQTNDRTVYSYLHFPLHDVSMQTDSEKKMNL